MQNTLPMNVTTIPNAKKKGYHLFTDIMRNPASYLLMLPAAAYTFIYGYMTLPWLVIAFQKYNFRLGLFHSPWVGLKNFEFFFKSTMAATVTFNTVYLNLLFLISGTIASVSLAILMNELKSKWYAKLTQSMMIFPNFISWVVVSYFVYLFFSTNEGMVNQGLKSVGMNGISWYQTPQVWPWILVVLRLWKGAGMGAVIYLSVITGFDSQVYEAAEIDGCNRFKQIWYITLPLLLPTVMIMTLMSIGGIFRGDFGMIFSIVRDNGILIPVTDVIDTYVFRAIRIIGDSSGATAIGLYQSLVGLVVVFFSNSLVRKYFSSGALF